MDTERESLADVECAPRDAVPREYDVPADETPAATCPHCGRPFRSERYATFHLEVSHAEELTAVERDTVERRREEEAYDRFTFQLKLVVTLLLTYALFVFVYALVWAA